ncbi:MAG: hypothetical protein RBU35_04820, partial [Anaerolineae bacterium]|nr:hypothetical protein [Anaerolineae bacterium]
RYVARAGAGRVAPLDAEAMAGHLAGLLSDPDALPAMGRRGQATAVALFGLEAVGRQLVEVYRQVLAAANQDRHHRRNPSPTLGRAGGG